MVEELRPTETLWPLGFCFPSFLLHPPFESRGEPLPALLEAPRRATPKAATSRDTLSPRCAQPDEVSRMGWGGPAPSSNYFIFLLFLILTIVHIFKENVFENKTPEVYIWDCDKATKDMKPQVSCFKSITPPGDGESLVDLCTDCI